MKTDDLIAMLAAGPIAVEPHALRRRFAMALGWGGFAATLLMAITLGVRPDLISALELPMFWVKLGFPALVLSGALLAAWRLARPGTKLASAPWWLAGPVLLIGLSAAIAIAGAPTGERAALVLGGSARVCSIYIAGLSLPAFVMMLWAMKLGAPTRPSWAGAAAGLAAGALGAWVYAWHCPEMAFPFLAVWYVLGMLIPGLAGLILGGRLLRW